MDNPEVWCHFCLAFAAAVLPLERARGELSLRGDALLLDRGELLSVALSFPFLVIVGGIGGEELADDRSSW